MKKGRREEDAYSRRLIGWAMEKEHDAELVKKALHILPRITQYDFAALETVSKTTFLELAKGEATCPMRKT